MIDPALDRRYADCQELVEAWRTYLEFYHVAVKSPDQINPQNEQGFLSAKARVAMLHDSFMDSLTRERQTGANMLGLINRSITLRHINKMGQADTKKMEIEWHEIYLLLSDTVTALEEDRTKLANISQSSHNMTRAMGKVKAGAKAFFGSFLFKVFIFFGVLAGLLSSLFIFEDDLREWGPTAKHFPKLLALERKMGIEAPYSNFAEFAAIAFKTREPKPEGIDKWENNGMTGTTVANVLGAQLGPAGDKVKEAGAKCRDGGAFAVTPTTPVPGPLPLVGALVFFNEGEAVGFESKFRDANTAPNSKFESVRKTNVVVLYACPDPVLRGRMKAAFTDPI